MLRKLWMCRNTEKSREKIQHKVCQALWFPACFPKYYIFFLLHPVLQWYKHLTCSLTFLCFYSCFFLVSVALFLSHLYLFNSFLISTQFYFRKLFLSGAGFGISLGVLGCQHFLFSLVLCCRDEIPDEYSLEVADWELLFTVTLSQVSSQECWDSNHHPSSYVRWEFYARRGSPRRTGATASSQSPACKAGVSLWKKWATIPISSSEAVTQIFLRGTESPGEQRTLKVSSELTTLFVRVWKIQM